MSKQRRLTWVEISELTGTDAETLRVYIREEWIRPATQETFDEEDLARLRLIQELQEDFGVNAESVPIILHLLDQVYLLREAMKKKMGHGA